MEIEIKFRAWDEKQKVMHYNFQFIASGDTGSDWIIFTSDKQKLSDKPHPCENLFFQAQLKRMLSTGLKDSKNKEVWQGDILKNQFGRIGIVDFGEGEYNPDWYEVKWVGFFSNGADMEFSKNTVGESEVIGNIYETPRLAPPKTPALADK